MPFSDRPADQVTVDDLQSLLGADAETKHIEYKRNLPGRPDNERKEYLYDVSSFANSDGGYLIFGVKEDQGKPTEIPGIPGINPDEEIRRLEAMLRDGIRPPVIVETAALALADGSYAFVMRIAKSWNPPHQVTFQNAFRFYARSSNGKYLLGVDELRSKVLLSENLAEKVRRFRTERCTKIVNGDAPVTLMGSGIYVLHIIPFSAFDLGHTFPLRRAAAEPHRFAPIGRPSGGIPQITLDGLIVTSNASPSPEKQRAYTQIFREGIVEAVASSIKRGEDRDWLPLASIGQDTIRYSQKYMRVLHEFGVEAPFVAMASLLDVKGQTIRQCAPSRFSFPEDTPPAPLRSEQVYFVDSVFQNVPIDEATAAHGLRATLNHMANAAGLASSPLFDDERNYNSKNP